MRLIRQLDHGASAVAFCALTAILYLVTLSTSPVHAAAETGKEHGAVLFREKGCEYCHGANGVGGGKGPDLREVRKRLSKEKMAQQITEGGGAMPAFGTSLEASEINDLVEFLRTKRK